MKVPDITMHKEREREPGLSGLRRGVERVMLTALLRPVEEQRRGLAGAEPAAEHTHTHHALGTRLANSEDEEQQAGGQQLPDDENHPEDDVPSVPEFTLKISLRGDEKKSRSGGQDLCVMEVSSLPLSHLSEVKVEEAEGEELQAHREAVEEPVGRGRQMVGSKSITEIKGEECGTQCCPEQAEKQKHALVAPSFMSTEEQQPELNVHH
ncbi:hypothetical protein DNTS_006276 [Danionella cerebrum]|uniref:Uncharacterized protein n=1 Tax=Danionella cerebrum TaxID=2873325 RepID=A0A553QFJ2_9TELE|nr:hypothetical protein DNTS_006276 [Danionella translucida]